MMMVRVITSMTARTLFFCSFGLRLAVLIMGEVFILGAATRSVRRFRIVHAAVVLLRCQRQVAVMRWVLVSPRFVVRVIVPGWRAVVFHT